MEINETGPISHSTYKNQLKEHSMLKYNISNYKVIRGKTQQESLMTMV